MDQIDCVIWIGTWERNLWKRVEGNRNKKGMKEQGREKEIEFSATGKKMLTIRKGVERMKERERGQMEK